MLAGDEGGSRQRGQRLQVCPHGYNPVSLRLCDDVELSKLLYGPIEVFPQGMESNRGPKGPVA